MRSRNRKKDRGFTIVELLIALVVGAIVLTAVLKMFIGHNRTQALQGQVAYAQQNVRASVDLMVRDIRTAGYDPTDSGLSTIPAASATSVQVRADLDVDGVTTGIGEDIAYGELTDADGTYLTRNGTKIVYDVVPNSLQLTYYRGDGTTFVPATQADRNEVRMVGVQLQVHTEQEDPYFSGGYDLVPGVSGTCRVRTLSTRVRLRNPGFEDLE